MRAASGRRSAARFSERTGCTERGDSQFLPGAPLFTVGRRCPRGRGRRPPHEPAAIPPEESGPPPPARHDPPSASRSHASPRRRLSRAAPLCPPPVRHVPTRRGPPGRGHHLQPPRQRLTNSAATVGTGASASMPTTAMTTSDAGARRHDGRRVLVQPGRQDPDQRCENTRVGDLVEFGLAEAHQHRIAHRADRCRTGRMDQQS